MPLADVKLPLRLSDSFANSPKRSKRSVSVLTTREVKPMSNTSSARDQNTCEYSMEEHERASALPTMDSTCPGCMTVVTPKTFWGKNMVFCHYYGQWYCKGCHKGEVSVIPALVVKNWNLKKYPACDAAMSEIRQSASIPCIDIGMYNPELYELSSTRLMEVRKLREKLMILREYIHTCKSSVALLQSLESRKHFVNAIHTYSLNDLVSAHEGGLVGAVKCEEHIRKCETCKAKGYICDVCNRQEILFPFQFEETSRCSTCRSVFHRSCHDLMRAERRPCPHCERKKKFQKTF